MHSWTGVVPAAQAGPWARAKSTWMAGGAAEGDEDEKPGTAEPSRTAVAREMRSRGAGCLAEDGNVRAKVASSSMA